MTILYGDSTPSSLETNFLEFLRDAVVFLVEVAHASHGVAEQVAIAETRTQETSLDFSRLDALETLVQRALADAPAVPAESATSRAAAAITHGVTEIVRSERDGAQAQLSRDVARTETETAQQLQRCVRALEALLARHDLPEVTETLRIHANVEAAYSAQLHCTTPYGLMFDLELDVPQGHLYTQPLRIDRILDRLEVTAPDMSGWLSKSIKLKPQRLERYHLVDLVISATGLRIKLRAMPDGTGDGFDLQIPPAPGRLSVVRIAESGETLGDATVPDDKETEGLRELADRLRTAGLELRMKRKKLTDARVDGDPMASLPEPALIIDRLVGAMSGIVREISRHSLSVDELVLKRMLADGKREEYFITVGELRTLLDQAPPSVRPRFAPLGLDARTAAALVIEQKSVASPAMAEHKSVASPPVAEHKSVAPPPAAEHQSLAPPPAPAHLEIVAGQDITSPNLADEDEVTLEVSVSKLEPVPIAPPPPPPSPVQEPTAAPKAILPRSEPSVPPRPRLPPRPSTAPPKNPGRGGSD